MEEPIAPLRQMSTASCPCRQVTTTGRGELKERLGEGQQKPEDMLSLVPGVHVGQNEGVMKVLRN